MALETHCSKLKMEFCFHSINLPGEYDWDGSIPVNRDLSIPITIKSLLMFCYWARNDLPISIKSVHSFHEIATQLRWSLHSKKSQTNQLCFTYSKALRSIYLSESSRCLLLEIWRVFCYFSELPFTYMNFVLIWLGLFIWCHLCKHALKWCTCRLICLGWNFN